MTQVVEAFCRLHELGTSYMLVGMRACRVAEYAFALWRFQSSKHSMLSVRMGAIFRGQRMVNWSPVLQTAVSDLEVLSSL